MNRVSEQCETSLSTPNIHIMGALEGEERDKSTKLRITMMPKLSHMVIPNCKGGWEM